MGLCCTQFLSFPNHFIKVTFKFVTKAIICWTLCLILDADDIEYHQEKQPETSAASKQDRPSAMTKQEPKYYESQISKIKERILKRLSPSKSIQTVHFKTISRREPSISRESATNTLSVIQSQLYRKSNMFDFAAPVGSYQAYSQMVSASKSHTAESAKATDTLSSSLVLENNHLVRSTSLFEIRAPFVSSIGRAESHRESNDASVANHLNSISQEALLPTQVTQTLGLDNWLTEGFASISKSTQRTEPIAELTNSDKGSYGLFTTSGVYVTTKHSNMMITERDPKDMKVLKISLEVPKMKSDNIQGMSESFYKLEPDKHSDSFKSFTSSGAYVTSKHSNMMVTERDPKDMKVLKINSEVPKMKSDNIQGMSESFYKLEPDIHFDSFKSSKSTLRSSSAGQNVHFASPSHLQRTQARHNLIFSSAAMDERSASHGEDCATKHLTKYSLSIKDDNIFQSTMISGSLKRDSSLQLGELSVEEMQDGYSKRHVSYTKYNGLNSFTKLRNSIEKSIMTSNHPSSTIKSLKIGSIKTLLYPTAPSTITMALQNHKSMGHQIIQSYDLDHPQYTKPSKPDHISLIATVQDRTIIATETEIIEKYTQVPTSQIYSSSSVTRLHNESISISIPLSVRNVEYAATNITKPTERFALNEKQTDTSLSSVHTLGLFSSLAVKQENAPIYLSQSLDRAYTEKVSISLSASPVSSSFAGLPPKRREDLASSLTKTMATPEYEPFGNTTVLDLHQVTNSLSAHFTDKQSEKELELTEYLLSSKSSTASSSTNVSRSKGSPGLSTERRPDSKTRLPLITQQSITLDESKMKIIQRSTNALQSSQQMHVSTHPWVTRSLSLPIPAKSSLHILLASNSRYPRYSTSSGVYSQLPSIIVKPARSSSVNAQPSTRLGEFENECTYRE